MLRPHKGNSGVLFNDTLLNFRTLLSNFVKLVYIPTNCRTLFKNRNSELSFWKIIFYSNPIQCSVGILTHSVHLPLRKAVYLFTLPFSFCALLPRIRDLGLINSDFNNHRFDNG